jgi:mannose-6-phosphate isomerase-like protein (cupin superfamily)
MKRTPSGSLNRCSADTPSSHRRVPHLIYVLSGHQKVVMDDGSELDIGPGDLVAIPPGHDGWVVGDDACVALDFAGMEHYAESQ